MAHPTTRRTVLTGLAILPAAAASAETQEADAAKKPDGSPRHDPVLRDTEHTRTFYRLART